MQSGPVRNPSLILALQQTTHVTLDALAGRLSDLSLTPAELNVLANLADGRPRSVGELGQAVGSRSSTLTGVLDRLARRGLLDRRPHPDDRRSVLVELTERGRSSAGRVARTYEELEAAALTRLSGSASESFHAVLAALREVSR